MSRKPLPTMGISDPLYTVEEAAEFLRTTVGAVRNLVWRKKLRAYKPQKRILIRHSELMTFVESSRTTGGPI